MRRNPMRDFFSGLMFGLAQVLSPIQKVLPTPPENTYLLLPNLNTATLDQLVDLLEVPPELAGRIVANRPYLNWDHFQAKIPEAPGGWKDKVRFLGIKKQPFWLLIKDIVAQYALFVKLMREVAHRLLQFSDKNTTGLNFCPRLCKGCPRGQEWTLSVRLTSRRSLGRPVHTTVGSAGFAGA